MQVLVVTDGGLLTPGRLDVVSGPGLLADPRVAGQGGGHLLR